MADDLSVRVPKSENRGLTRVIRIVSHSQADVAIVFVARDEITLPDPIPVTNSLIRPGDEMQSFGYPEDVFGADASRPVPRIFRGYVQRFLNYERAGYRYLAAELSFGVPPGLSGGPVWKPDWYPEIIGLITENLTSTTMQESSERVVRGGETHVTIYQTIINYGICLLLEPLQPWLLEQIGDP